MVSPERVVGQQELQEAVKHMEAQQQFFFWLLDWAQVGHTR